MESTNTPDILDLIKLHFEERGYEVTRLTGKLIVGSADIWTTESIWGIIDDPPGVFVSRHEGGAWDPSSRLDPYSPNFLEEIEKEVEKIHG